jgi:hypothetical protein
MLDSLQYSSGNSCSIRVWQPPAHVNTCLNSSQKSRRTAIISELSAYLIPGLKTYSTSTGKLYYPGNPTAATCPYDPMPDSTTTRQLSYPGSQKQLLAYVIPRLTLCSISLEQMQYLDTQQHPLFHVITLQLAAQQRHSCDIHDTQQQPLGPCDPMHDSLQRSSRAALISGIPNSRHAVRVASWKFLLFSSMSLVLQTTKPGGKGYSNAQVLSSRVPTI